MPATGTASTLASRATILYCVVFVSVLYVILYVRPPGTVRALREKASFWNGRIPSTQEYVPPLPPTLEHGVDARLEWDDAQVPKSKLLRQAPGWCIPVYSCII